MDVAISRRETPAFAKSLIARALRLGIREVICEPL